MASLRKAVYVASASPTFTSVASLASSSTLVAGAECAAIDNSSNLYLDYLLSGIIKTATGQSAGRIEVWVVPEMDDSTWPDVFAGTDAARTVTNADIKAACAALAATIITTTTSNQVYPFAKISVASLFGGVCPRKFSVFVTHNCGGTLNATGSAIYQEAYYENLNG